MRFYRARRLCLPDQYLPGSVSVLGGGSREEEEEENWCVEESG